MNALNLLTQEHFLESEARLRHVDELMAMSRTGSVTGFVGLHGGADAHPIQADCNRSAHEPGRPRDRPRVGRSEGIRGAEGLSSPLKIVGLEFEKALTAVLVKA